MLLVVAAAFGLGGDVAALQVAGVALAVAGILAVRGARSPGGALEVGLSLAVAACIAGYTLVDRAGVQDADPITYLWLVLALATPPDLGAVRETSVVIATALAAIVLRERVSPARWAGAVVVTAGIALIALG